MLLPERGRHEPRCPPDRGAWNHIPALNRSVWGELKLRYDAWEIAWAATLLSWRGRYSALHINLPEHTDHFDDYIAVVEWAQDYVCSNRDMMM